MWQIVVPAWGRHYVDIALRVSLPAMVAAAGNARHDAEFLIYTDEPEAFVSACYPFRTQVRRVPSGATFSEFARCHASALREAAVGTYVALLNADHIVSREIFRACERQFDAGKKLVLCGAMRTVEREPPPPGSDARTVIDFMLAAPHPMSLESLWPTGGTNAPNLLYLWEGDNVAVHGLHLHPAGVVKHEGLSFTGTADVALAEAFTEDEIHIVTDPTELALAEMSPPGKAYSVAEKPNDARRIARWARATSTARNLWQFGHRVMLRGDPNFLDDPIPDILALGDQVKRAIDPSDDVTLRYAPEVFTLDSIEAARRLILTPAHGFTTDERWEAETAWLSDNIEMPPGLVLDIGCGIGRLSRVFTQRGHPVVGMDISPSMRAMAEVEVADPGHFSAISPSMLHFLVANGLRVSGALAVWTFQHILAEELSLTLSVVCEALPPGAPLWVLDQDRRVIPVSMDGDFGWNKGWADDGCILSDLLATQFIRDQEIPMPDRLGERDVILRRWRRK